MIDVLATKSAIGKCKALISMSANPYIFSRNVPTGDLPVDQADYLFLIFSRYSLRALYHADLFLHNYEKITCLNRTELSEGQEVGVPAPDHIYFDFDAFMISCKSVMESNIVKRANSLEQKLIPVFIQIAEKAKASIIDPWIKPIRNECIHLNTFGTSIGSMAWIKMQNDSLVIRLISNYKTFHGERAELTELFKIILNGFLDICWKVSGIFLAHAFIKYEAPQKNICYKHSGFSVSLSEIEMLIRPNTYKASRCQG